MVMEKKGESFKAAQRRQLQEGWAKRVSGEKDRPRGPLDGAGKAVLEGLVQEAAVRSDGKAAARRTKRIAKGSAGSAAKKVSRGRPQVSAEGRAVVVSTGLAPGVLARLDGECERREVGRSEVLREVIGLGLEELERRLK